jgi:hypothetical protein
VVVKYSTLPFPLHMFNTHGRKISIQGSSEENMPILITNHSSTSYFQYMIEFSGPQSTFKFRYRVFIFIFIFFLKFKFCHFVSSLSNFEVWYNSSSGSGISRFWLYCSCDDGSAFFTFKKLFSFLLFLLLYWILFFYTETFWLKCCLQRRTVLCPQFKIV